MAVAIIMRKDGGDQVKMTLDCDSERYITTNMQ